MTLPGGRGVLFLVERLQVWNGGTVAPPVHQRVEGLYLRGEALVIK